MIIVSLNRPLDILDIHTEIQESGTVYDYTWLNDSLEPHLLTTVQHEPIKMYDLCGQLTASYRGYDDVDEVENALSVASSSDGSTILGGYKKNIKLFDTERYSNYFSNCISAELPFHFQTRTRLQNSFDQMPDIHPR